MSLTATVVVVNMQAISMYFVKKIKLCRSPSLSYGKGKIRRENACILKKVAHCMWDWSSSQSNKSSITTGISLNSIGITFCSVSDNTNTYNLHNVFDFQVYLYWHAFYFHHRLCRYIVHASVVANVWNWCSRCYVIYANIGYVLWFFLCKVTSLTSVSPAEQGNISLTWLCFYEIVYANCSRIN